MLQNVAQLIIQVFIFTFIFTYLINSIRPKKVDLSEWTIIFILYGLSILASMIIGIIAAPVMLLCLCVFFIIKKEHILVSISMLFITYIILAISNVLVEAVAYVLGYNMEILLNNSVSNLIILIIIALFATALSYLIGKFFQSKVKKIVQYKALSAIMSINLLVCVVVFVFNIIVSEPLGYSSTVTYFNGFLFFIYFIVTSLSLATIFKSYMKKIKLDSRKESFEHLLDYTHKIESMYSGLRSFKHDHANIMLSMNEYIENQDIDGLKNYYYNEVLPQTKDILNNQFDSSRLINILTPEIKSLIYGKAIYASEIGINFEIEVTEPIVVKNINIIDLTRILGVFLDNAIEACIETNDPRISMSFINNRSALAILITNTFIDQQIPIAEINKLSFSTKGKNRGIGLYNVEQIITNYSNLFWEMEINNNMFIQHLEITDLSDISFLE